MMAEVAQMVQTEWITLDVGGFPMEAYVAKPHGAGPWPAVLVFMEIFGVNSHIRSVTERIAAEGYLVIAINYYHRTTKNLELGYTEADVAEGRKHKDAVTWGGVMEDLWATFDYLNGRPDVLPKHRFGCVGFCFGGHVAYMAATLEQIAVTASFYAGGVATSTPGGGAPTVSHSGSIQGEILCLFGKNDPLIPQEDTVTVEQSLQMAGVTHEVVRYDAGHGFFCDQREDYNPEVAQDAWQRVKQLFSKLR